MTQIASSQSLGFLLFEQGPRYLHEIITNPSSSSLKARKTNTSIKIAMPVEKDLIPQQCLGCSCWFDKILETSTPSTFLDFQGLFFSFNRKEIKPLDLMKHFSHLQFILHIHAYIYRLYSNTSNALAILVIPTLVADM